MKRYLAMLGLMTVLAAPAVAGAEVKLTPGSEEYFLLYGTTQAVAPLLTKQSAVTGEEPIAVSTLEAETPAKAKGDQAGAQHFRWAGVDGAAY